MVKSEISVDKLLLFKLGPFDINKTENKWQNKRDKHEKKQVLDTHHASGGKAISWGHAGKLRTQTGELMGNFFLRRVPG